MGVLPPIHGCICCSSNNGHRSGLDAAHALAPICETPSPTITQFDRLNIRVDLKELGYPNRQKCVQHPPLPGIQELFALSDGGSGGYSIKRQSSWERRSSYGSDIMPPPTPMSICSDTPRLERRFTPQLQPLSLSAYCPGEGLVRSQLLTPPTTPLGDVFVPPPVGPSSSSFRFAYPVTLSDYPVVAAGGSCSRPTAITAKASPSLSPRRRGVDCRRLARPAEMDVEGARSLTLRGRMRTSEARRGDLATHSRRRSAKQQRPTIQGTAATATPTNAARRRTGVKRDPGSNAKYPIAHADFIVYTRVERGLKWEAVTREYNAAQDRLRPYLDAAEAAQSLPSHRKQDGVLAIFYRVNEAVPVLDGQGGIAFSKDGRCEMDEWIKCRDEKKYGIKLPGLIDRYPERVVAMNYWFVDEQDMQRARREAAIRDAQRRERGLPTWAEQQEMKLQPERDYIPRVAESDP